MAKPKKPEVRRVDAQFRISLPDDVREALTVDKDDYVFFTIEKDRRVELHKVKLENAA